MSWHKFYNSVLCLFITVLVDGAHRKTQSKCGQPPHVDYAQPQSTMLNQRLFDQGTDIPYVCHPGYYANDRGMARAKCIAINGTAMWHGPDIICRPRSCGHPIDPMNGERKGNNFHFPNIVEYKCHIGYELTAFESRIRKCQANGQWSGVRAVCQAVQCPRPEPPMYGKVVGFSLDYQSRITYVCDHGYEPIGSHHRYCQADKTWTGNAPTCQQKKCDPPKRPTNGYIEPSDSTRALGSIIIYRCYEDSTADGPGEAKCTEDGWSNPPPQCLHGCTVPRVPNSRNIIGKQPGETAHHGANWEYECAPGYEKKTQAISECKNGTWKPDIPECVKMRCQDWPPAQANAIVLFARNDHGSVARYVCKPGYEIKNRIDSDGLYTCIDGKWIGKPFECTEKTCPNPRLLPHLVNFTGVIKLEGSMGNYEYHAHFQEVGENRQLTFECGKKFYLHGGPNKATCINGTWMPIFTPECLPLEHPPLEERDRPDWSNLRNERSVQYPDDESGITVFKYHWLSSRRKKRHSGSNSDNSEDVVLYVKPPRRKRKHHTTCPPLRLTEKQSYARINHLPLEDGRFISDTELMIICRPGYELPNAQNTIACKNGTWKPTVSMCRPKRCPLPAKSNAFFTWKGEVVNHGHHVGHREGAKMFCLRGYELRGDDELECNLGDWLKSAGDCVPQSCIVPYLRYGHYRNDSVTGTSVEHATKVDFYCNLGHYPNPPQSEVYCSYGIFRLHDPECNEDVNIQRTSRLSLGCTRPYELDNAWVYMKDPITNRRMLIDPQMAVFPNRTIIHYKCSESFDDEYGRTRRRRLKRVSSLSSLYTHDEAHAVECKDGEWVALLIECAPSGRMPPGVESNSTQLTNLQLFGASRMPCIRPNSTEVMYDSNEWLFSHGFKLRVYCLNDRSRSWIVKCRRGVWRGFEENSCRRPGPDVQSTPTQTCEFNPLHFKSMSAFYEQRKEPIIFKERLPEGAMLVVRCQHVGLYQFTGTKRLLCRNGVWQGGNAKCRSLSLPWKEGQAPPIAYRASEGDLSLTNDGDIVVRKSSTLELDCLVPKQKIQPYWDYSNSYRKYPQQWSKFTLEPWELGNPEESNHSMRLDAFRLTIFMARPEDSGIFHCITPSGLRHSVRVRVTDVNCPNYERMIRRTQSTSSNSELNTLKVYPTVKASKASAFGSILHFACPIGYKVVGASRIYCLEDGKWSQPTPTCEIVQCPILTQKHPALRIEVNSNLYNNIATFSCADGFVLQGPYYVQCNASGDWNDVIPTCRVATCLPPDLPRGAKILSTSQNYTYGDVVRFMCEEPGYMQTGRDFAVCNQYGHWSNPPPECQRYCLFPGKPENGDTTMDSRRIYLVGQRIVYYCDPQYTVMGNHDLECMPNGQWSSDIPQCRLANGHDEIDMDFMMRPRVVG